MISQVNRLKTEDFEGLMKTGKVYHSPLFSVRFSKRGNDADNKYAVVVSKKTAPKAVDRNKIKRKVRLVIRELLPLVNTTGVLIAVFVKKDLENEKFDDVKGELSEVFSKIGLFEGGK